MKRKIILVALLLVAAGVTSAQNNGGKETVQLLNSGKSLKSVYAVDSQDNFIGMIFGEESSQFFGNVDSFSELNVSTTEICRQYIRQGGLLRGERVSQVECMPLEPTENGENTEISETNSEISQASNGISRIQYMGNGTVNPPERIPDFFRAFDTQGRNLIIHLNDRGEMTNIFGNVGSLEELDQETLVACEYFIQLNIFDRDNPSETNCFGYQELQERIRNGSINYLPSERLENTTPSVGPQNRSSDNSSTVPG